MSSCTDGNYNWIGHYKDHFSRFSIIWAQKQKCAVETVKCIERFVFSYLGVPKLLQSDNGKEFNNKVHTYSLHLQLAMYVVYLFCILVI